MAQSPPRYFDRLLAEIDDEESALGEAYGRHVHWGFWDDPSTATNTARDFTTATEAMSLQLCDLAGVREGDHVLDVGCGFGGTLASLNERRQSMMLTGLNIDWRQLTRARRQVIARADNVVAFCVGDACALPYADASVDRLLAVECVFHFASRETFFREARRVLKPGGVLALSDFVPARAVVPLAWAAALPWLERLEGSGRFDVRCTGPGYRRLAARTGLRPRVARDVTRNTLPTYGHLRRLATPGLTRRELVAFSAMMGLLRFWASAGLLRYYLLAFERPGPDEGEGA